MNNKTLNNEKGIYAQIWDQLPEHANYYSFRHGSYTPNKNDLLNKNPGINPQLIDQAIWRYEIDCSGDISGDNFQKFLTKNNSIEISGIWEKLSKIKKGIEISEIKREVFKMVSSSFKTKAMITGNTDKQSKIPEICKKLGEIIEFITPFNQQENTDILSHKTEMGADLIHLSSFVDDLTKTSMQFGFEDREFTSKDIDGNTYQNTEIGADYFKFLMDEYLPSPAMILLKLKHKLNLIHKTNLQTKQKKGSTIKIVNIEALYFCRHLSDKFKTWTGKPNFKIVSVFTAYIFGEHTDIDFSEDYVKQNYYRANKPNEYNANINKTEHELILEFISESDKKSDN